MSISNGGPEIKIRHFASWREKFPKVPDMFLKYAATFGLDDFQELPKYGHQWPKWACWAQAQCFREFVRCGRKPLMPDVAEGCYQAGLAMYNVKRES